MLFMNAHFEVYNSRMVFGNVIYLSRLFLLTYLGGDFCDGLNNNVEDVEAKERGIEDSEELSQPSQ
jgi:hypothetical protein